MTVCMRNFGNNKGFLQTGLVKRICYGKKNHPQLNETRVYDSIIQEKRENKIIERVKVEEVNEDTHGPVIRKSIETVKVRI